MTWRLTNHSLTPTISPFQENNLEEKGNDTQVENEDNQQCSMSRSMEFNITIISYRVSNTMEMEGLIQGLGEKRNKMDRQKNTPKVEHKSHKVSRGNARLGNEQQLLKGALGNRLECELLIILIIFIILIILIMTSKS